MKPEPNSQPTKSQDNPKKTLLDTDQDDGSVLNDIRVPDIDAAGSDEDAPVNVKAQSDPVQEVKKKIEYIGEDAFFELFQMAFYYPAKAMKLPALAIQDDEKIPAHHASDAGYRIVKIFAPSMITKETQTFKDFAVLGSFLAFKAFIVSEWMQTRKQLISAQNDPAEFQRSGSQNKRPDENGSEIQPAAFGTGNTDNWEIEVRQ